MARHDTQYTLYSTGRCDPSFSNIWGFTSEVERETWLLTKSPFPVLNCTFWRPGSSVKVKISYDDSLKYDYIRITNNVTTNKTVWFAFITSRQYISPNLTLFNLQIDYIQTYYFSQTLDGGKSPFWNVNAFIMKSTGNFVFERGTPSDYPVPVLTPVSIQFESNNFFFVVYSTVDLTQLTNDNVVYTQAVIDGVYMASVPYIFKTSSSSVMTGIFTVLNEKGLTDAVTGMYVIPSSYVADTGADIAICTNDQLTRRTHTISKPTNCDGYTPVNDILLYSDYTYFTINNNQGEIQSYHFEDFNGDPVFESWVTVNSGSPVINIKPNNYKDSVNDNYRQRGQKITQIPACSYINDTYKIWLAQTQNSRAAAVDAALDEIDLRKSIRESSIAYQLYKSGVAGNILTGAGSLTNSIVNSIDGLIGNPLNTDKMSASVLPSNGSFGGGSSSGTGAGRSFGFANPNDMSSEIGKNLGSNNTGTMLAGLTQLYIYKELNLEESVIKNADVLRAQNSLNQLLAGYADKSAVPATARGSNAYGDMTAFNQVGFTITVYTPTNYYAQWLDKMFTASGITYNKYGFIKKYHDTFDYYQCNSAQILGDPENRPQFVRNLMVSILQSGVYIWYIKDQDISPYIGLPYNITNLEVD